MRFRVRWYDIVKRPGDSATNEACTIRQIDEQKWEIQSSNIVTARTVEGVELLLEEYCVRDEGWRTAEG